MAREQIWAISSEPSGQCLTWSHRAVTGRQRVPSTHQNSPTRQGFSGTSSSRLQTSSSEESSQSRTPSQHAVRVTHWCEWVHQNSWMGQVSSILGGGSSQLNSSLPSKHSIWPSHTWFHLRQRESSWHMKPLHWSMMVQNLPSSAPSAQSYLSSHSWYSFTHDPSVHMNSSVSQ